ncbi:MAG: glutamyl-tRNA reductase [Dehalococcoidia bacterium]
MQISLVGISHKTAPVAVREHFAFVPDEMPELLSRLGERFAGAAVVSTCNRTEVYVAGARGISDPRPIVALLSEFKGELAVEGAPFFVLPEKEASRHLFRVAAGIDSMVIGESEILGQVRHAFTLATAAGTHTPALSRLFHTAIRVGRKVRTQTAIGRHAVSVSSTAVALAKNTLGDLVDKTVFVIGAGEAGELTARNLAGVGVARIIVTSRRTERAAALATDLGGTPVAFEDRERAIEDADIVISSTAANDCVIDRAMVERVMARRNGRRLLVIDIAVPRDVDADVAGVPGVHLYDIDAMQAVAQQNMHLRRKELAQADAIVDEAVVKFAEWLGSLEVVPTVTAMRARAEAVRLEELRRTLSKTNMSDADRKRVEAMSAALVKKLLHAPINKLKSSGGGERYVESARALFGLDDDGVDAPEAD